MGEEFRPLSFGKVLTRSDVEVEKTAQLTIPKACGIALFPPQGGSVTIRDAEGKIWLFRHGVNGKPERHRLSTGWSGFVKEKRPSIGDTVVFERNRRGELLIELRPTSRSRSLLVPSLAERARQVYRDESDASSRVTVAIPPSGVPLSGYFVWESSRACPPSKKLKIGGESPNRPSVSGEKKNKKKTQNIVRYLNARAEGRGRSRTIAPDGVQGARTTQSVEVQPSEAVPGILPAGSDRRSFRLFGQTILIGRDGGDDAEPSCSDSTRKPRASP